MSAARRSGRTPSVGRMLLIAALVFTAAFVVIWRRAESTRVQRHIGALEVALADLESRRRTLRSEIAELSAEERIRTAAARRLGLRSPAETQLIDIPRVPRAAAADTGRLP